MVIIGMCTDRDMGLHFSHVQTCVWKSISTTQATMAAPPQGFAPPPPPTPMVAVPIGGPTTVVVHEAASCCQKEIGKAGRISATVFSGLAWLTFLVGMCINK